MGYSFYFGVALPVVAIIIGNFIVLIKVIHGLSKSTKMSKSQNTNRKRYLGQARIAFSCSILLGLTWVFALLAVSEAKIFFQWLFCIFNSLQGFFIFLFYTARNPEVRKEWAKCFGIGSYGNTSSNSSGTGGRQHELKNKGGRLSSQ